MVAFQAMIQLKVLGDGLNLWHNKPGAYWIKVPNQSTQRIVPISEKVTPLARQEQSRSLEELRERAWSLPWPIVEAAALVENKVAVIFAVVVVIIVIVVVVVASLADQVGRFTMREEVHTALKYDFRQSDGCRKTLALSGAVATIPSSSLKSNCATFTW